MIRSYGAVSLVLQERTVCAIKSATEQDRGYDPLLRGCLTGFAGAHRVRD